MQKNNKGFTLIEVIVSLTIFSIMMISIISIYILNSEISIKSNINRVIHENIKNIVTEISEDIIKNGISGVSNSTLDECNFDLTDNYKEGTKLCTNALNTYYLAKKNTGGSYVRVENADCSDFVEQCYLVKNGVPITNSLVSIKNIKFYISDLEVNKATLVIDLQPTAKAGIKASMIENNNIIFQTTISERLF